MGTSSEGSLVGLLVLLLVVVVVIAIGAWAKVTQLQKSIEDEVRKRYDEWRQKDLQGAQHALMEAARSEARSDLEVWKMQHEAGIRQDAITRSRAVTIGKVSEHIAPYLPAFPYNPKDARFIGSPIDILVFDGADEGEVREIVFLEIKSANSSLTPRQKQVRDCVQQGRVAWRELRVELQV